VFLKKGRFILMILMLRRYQWTWILCLKRIISRWW